MGEGRELAQDHKASKCWTLNPNLDQSGCKALPIKHCEKGEKKSFNQDY